MNSNSNASSASSIIFCGGESGNQISEKLNADLIFLQSGQGVKLILDVADKAPEWVTKDQNIILNIIWPSKGLLVFSARIVYVLGNNVHLGNISYIETLQRRNDLKVPIEGEGILSNESGFRAKVHLLNISAGGVGFYIPKADNLEQFVLSGFYNLHFTFDKNNLCDAKIHILRADSNKDGSLNCGAKFYQPNSKFESRLRSFIYKRQLDDTPEERYIKAHTVEIDVMMRSDKGYEDSVSYKK